jgi:ferredoxin-NADP reductase
VAETAELIEVVVARRDVVAEDIIALELAPKAGGRLPGFAAGSHVDVHVGPGLVRQYSLCNDPAETGSYRLGILREPASRGGSAGIHEGAQVGRALTISAPRNNFVMAEDAPNTILLGGGIGVTPLIAMAYRLHHLGRPFELHYCTRSAARTAFADELAKAPFAASVHIHHDDGPQAQKFDPAGLPPAADGAHLYVCGPGGFMEWVIGSATSLGYPDERVHREYFNAEVDTSGGAFTVEARRSGKTVTVPEGKSIAEALAEVGIDIPLSCEQGVCGTCLVDVISGIPDHRDMYQTDGEKASNKQITPCCSRALSSVLVLDV